MPDRGRFKNIDSWPEVERARWKRGLSPASLLDATAHAAKWQQETAIKNSRGWATYINWLDTNGRLMDDEQPEQRITRARINAYCAYLDGSVKPTTVRCRLYELVRALSVLAPDADVSYIRRLSYLYPKRGDPLAKRARMQESAVLLQLGLDLMAECRTPTGSKESIRYRDGLLIAFLACRALRLRNLTNIEINRQLVQIDERWSLRFAPTETKTHRSWINSWPDLLVPHLIEYLEVYRPLLIGNCDDCNDLWISAKSGPLSKRGVYLAVTKRTKAAFGKSVNPHLFRDAAATSLAVHDPANVQLSRHVLGHARYGTAQDYYNQARCLEASSNLNETMQRLRRRGA